MNSLHRWINSIILIVGFVVVYLNTQKQETTIEQCQDRLYEIVKGSTGEIQSTTE